MLRCWISKRRTSEKLSFGSCSVYKPHEPPTEVPRERWNVEALQAGNEGGDDVGSLPETDTAVSILREVSNDREERSDEENSFLRFHTGALLLPARSPCLSGSRIAF